MSKVDWIAAEADYITQPASYGAIARKYKVAKSTVVRQAKQHSWTRAKELYDKRRLDILQERTLEKRLDAEERQLRVLRIAQSVFNNEILRLGSKQLKGDDISSKEWRDIALLSNAASKAMMTERLILELPTKPIRVTDEQMIDNIQIMMGYKEEPPGKQLEELKEAALTLDRMIERKKMIQGLIDSYDK